MDSLLPSLVLLGVLLITASRLGGIGVTAYDDLGQSWRDAVVRSELRLASDLSITSVNAKGTDVDVVVRNDGSVTFDEFSNMDVVVQYSTGTETLTKWLPYTNAAQLNDSWTLLTILDDVTDPGVVNPDESMLMRLCLSPAVGPFTNVNWVQVTNDAGLSAATSFLGGEDAGGCGRSAFYFSLRDDGSVGSLTVANEDIIAWDGDAGFSLTFDGSDVGLGGLQTDALAFIDATHLLMSFTTPASIPGIPGTVDDSDIVKFTASSLGTTTAGSFELYFDGSDVQLNGEGEDVDGLDLLPDGDLLITMSGNFNVTGASGNDSDIIRFTPTQLGDTTAGAWTFYVDGSDVDLTTNGEALNGIAVDDVADIHLTTDGDFSVTGVSGAGEDAFIFTPLTLGADTTGTYAAAVFFDGSAHGIASNAVSSLDLP